MYVVNAGHIPCSRKRKKQGGQLLQLVKFSAARQLLVEWILPARKILAMFNEAFVWYHYLSRYVQCQEIPLFSIIMC